MSKKEYDWKNGAVLEDHSKKKHEILGIYFREYLITRCQLPQQEKFRLAVVDGFSGAGLYKGGEYGSPLIFLETLVSTTNQINLDRATQGLKPIQIDCLLIFNDFNANVIDQLKQNLSPYLIKAADTCSNLFVKTDFYSKDFREIYPEMKSKIQSAKYSNVLFNLDQCGYSEIETIVIGDIMRSWQSAEIIFTFAIESMLTYLSPDKNKNSVPLESELENKIYNLTDERKGLMNKEQWLGQAEKIVFTYLKQCAPYVSPFSINNPSGWMYWLMHFANSYRARQVFNDVLHQDQATQVHYGRHGLNMLSYDPRDNVRLYLFDENSRISAKDALRDDVPRFVDESGDALLVMDFYAAAYSETPAHSDDIHQIIIESPDLEVITESGGSRRVANTIKPTDTLRLKNQKSMFFMYSRDDK